jgi:hypothetical protein
MMSRKIRRNLSVLLLGAAALIAGQAQAQNVEYDFTVNWTSNSLSGTTSTGSFAFDAASITPGSIVYGSDLLTALSFNFLGKNWDTTSAHTALLSFDSTGALTDAWFGNTCSGGGGTGQCSISGNGDWYVTAGAGSAALPPAQESSSLGTAVYTPVAATPVAAVPEPSTYALMLAGLGVVGFVARRRRQS